jgi:hypothetical protein
MQRLANKWSAETRAGYAEELRDIALLATKTADEIERIIDEQAA